MTEARGRPGPARGLAEADILRAALRLLDDAGAARLSLRSVAAAVGVTPGAIYTYFPTKSALVGALVDEVLGSVDLDVLDAPDPTGAGRSETNRTWTDRVRAVALAWRATLLAHPGVVPLLLGAPFDGPHALAAGERLLAAFAERGLDGHDGARASYLFMTYVLGTVALDVAELEPGAPAVDEAARTRTRRQALTGLPADRYPRTSAALDDIAAYTSTAQFLWGLDRLLDGITGRP